MVYPLYLLFQPNREPGKQMHQAVEDATQLPTVDTPIQQVLLFVDTLSLKEANKDSGGAGAQGRKGEFVNLPVIKLLVAKFVFGDTRQDLSGNREAQTDKAFLSPALRCINGTAPSLPCSLTDNRPLIRGIATQLLSRTLVLVTARNEILDILTTQQQQKLQERIIREVASYWRHQRLTHQKDRKLHTLLPLLGRTFAKLKSNHLALSTRVITRASSWTISPQVKTQLKQHHSDTAVATARVENYTLRIQALIWAAIDYFFGNRHEKPTLATASTHDSGRLLASKLPRKLLNRHRIAAEFSPIVSSDVDPWLTLSDLFGDVEPSQQIPGSSNQKTRQVARRINLALPFGKLSIPALTRTWRTAKTAAATTHPLTAISSLQAKSAKEYSQFCSQDTQHEAAAAWIETDATVIGYVKHPLEQLLEWLDRIMVWLEEVLMIVWRWMRSLVD